MAQGGISATLGQAHRTQLFLIHMESIMHHFLSWLNPAPIGESQKSQDLPCALDDNELESAAGGYKQREDGSGCTDIPTRRGK
jgi:hypothetical protein